MATRGARRAAVLLAGAGLALLAAPASADTATVSISNFRFSPDTSSIHRGDTVTWSWTGPDRNHTVTSDSGQAESFESHPGTATPAVTDGPPGETFSHTFMNVGTFTYYCRVHPYMRAKVVVAAPGAPLADTTAPSTTLRISSASLRRVLRSHRVQARVTVNEAATETLTLEAVGRTAATKTVSFGGAGSKTVSLRLSRVARRALASRRRVKFTLVAKARDSAGNTRTTRTSKTLGSRPRSRSMGSPAPVY